MPNSPAALQVFITLLTLKLLMAAIAIKAEAVLRRKRWNPSAVVVLAGKPDKQRNSA